LWDIKKAETEDASAFVDWVVGLLALAIVGVAALGADSHRNGDRSGFSLLLFGVQEVFQIIQNLTYPICNIIENITLRTAHSFSPFKPCDENKNPRVSHATKGFPVLWT
jgi:hypothetical protein